MSSAAHHSVDHLAAIPDDADLADAANGWKSAYVHVPFCRRRCPYCDFAIVDESAEDVSHERYVGALLSEIRMEDDFGPLDAVNFGGGTPSRLAVGSLESVFKALSDRFGLAGDAEVSIEVNPEDWTDSMGDELVAAGFTRISIGAQSMDSGVLGVLGRLHEPPQVENVVTRARDAGIRSISVDVMIGHPAETEKSWRRSTEAVLALPVDHLSTYALTVERGTQLAKEISSGAQGPDDDIQADRYEALEQEARDEGFVRYEVSNLAKLGHACRYNLATWAHAEYVAFGMGAHDHRWGVRSRNHRRIDRYFDGIDRGVRPRLGSEELDVSEQERDRLMLGLRLAAGAPMSELAACFVESQAGQRLISAGIIEVSGGRVIVTDLLLADAAAREALSVSVGDC